MKEYKVGDKIRFKGEVKPYTIRACDDRYLICTKPYNLKYTVLYTIVDLKKNIRGTDWWIFGIYDYRMKDECEQCLRDLNSGETEISKRNRVELEIEE